MTPPTPDYVLHEDILHEIQAQIKDISTTVHNINDSLLGGENDAGVFERLRTLEAKSKELEERPRGWKSNVQFGITIVLAMLAMLGFAAARCNYDPVIAKIEKARNK